MFHYGNRGRWQCIFIGVPMLNFINGACVKMVLGGNAFYVITSIVVRLLLVTVIG